MRTGWSLCRGSLSIVNRRAGDTGPRNLNIFRRQAAAVSVRVRIIEPALSALDKRRVRVPIHSGGMLKSPINRNPSRPPFLGSDGFRANHIARGIEVREILPRENAPVAVEERAPEEIGKLLQRFQVRRI